MPTPVPSCYRLLLLSNHPHDNQGPLGVPLLYPENHSPCQAQTAFLLRDSKDRGGAMCPGHGRVVPLLEGAKGNQKSSLFPVSASTT